MKECQSLINPPGEIQGRLFESLKTELEAVQQDFIRLVNAVSDEDWERKLPGSPWTARCEMVHILQALEVVAKGIDKAISGKGRSPLSYVPGAVRGWVNGYLIVPALAKRFTKGSLIQAYEAATLAFIEKLETLSSGDWEKGAKYPRKYRTVEEMAHRPREHFDEHTANLCEGLGL